MPADLTLLKRRKELQEERAGAIDGASALLKKTFTEKRALTAEEQTEWEKRHATGDTLQKQIEQLDVQIRTNETLDKPQRDSRRAGFEDLGGDRNDDTSKKRMDDVAKLRFRTYVQGGPDALTDEDREAYQSAMSDLTPAEKRALGVASSSTGGALVPQGFMNNLEIATKWFGGIVDAADYINTDSGEALPWPSANDTGNTAAVVAESGGLSSSADPTFAATTFNAYNIVTDIVKVPIQLLQDSAFDVEKFLQDSLNVRIQRKVNALATTGSGSSTLTGVVIAATAGVTNFPAATISYSDITDLTYSVDRSYRSGPKVGFMFADGTMKILRKLLDTAGNPIFRRGLITEGLATNREPDTLDGYPVYINNDMATPAAAAKTVLFGDFSKFKIRRVKQIMVFRFNELYMANGQVGFVAMQRFDSNLVDAGTHPIKFLTQGAS